MTKNLSQLWVNLGEGGVLQPVNLQRLAHPSSNVRRVFIFTLWHQRGETGILWSSARLSSSWSCKKLKEVGVNG